MAAPLPAPGLSPRPPSLQDRNGLRISPATLGRLVREVATAGQWRDIAVFCTGERWFQRLELTANYEIWLLTWLPGQQTGFHDHGEAAGAFTVAQGSVLETLARPGSRLTRRRPAVEGTVRMFGAAHLHDVANISGVPAVSVHAYSPPLMAMRRYAMTKTGLTFVRTDHAELDW
jgi:hypothetical protein